MPPRTTLLCSYISAALWDHRLHVVSKIEFRLFALCHFCKRGVDVMCFYSYVLNECSVNARYCNNYVWPVTKYAQETTY